MYHLITEDLCGAPVRIRKEDAYMDLTAMCLPRGKRPAEFLRLPSTVAYIPELANHTGIAAENLIITQRGGDQKSDGIKVGFSHFDPDLTKPGFSRFAGEFGNVPGTWVHPLLAIECARWLSPRLGVQCNEIVYRLLNGETVKGVALSPAQQRRRRLQLRLRGAEAREVIDDVRRAFDAMRAAAEIPAHVAIREWLVEHGLTLDHSARSRLGTRLSTAVRRGEITAGEKTVPVDNAARAQRVPTYAPEAIAAAHAGLFPAPSAGLLPG